MGSKINLPNDFDNKIKITIEKACIKSKLKQKNKKKKIIAASIGFTFTSSFFLFNPQYVEAAIDSIKEIFAKRNYSIVLDNESLNNNSVYETEKLGVKFKYEVDTNTSGVIKIKQTVDRSKAMANDWKIKNNSNINLDSLGNLTAEVISSEKQKEIVEKIYQGKDISSDIEEIEKLLSEGQGDKYLIEYLEEIKFAYDWAMSDEDFHYTKGAIYTNYITLNGEKVETESSYEGDIENIDIIIPEHLIGKKDLELEIKTKEVGLVEKLPIVIEEMPSINIDLKASKKESSIKHIDINHSYELEGLRKSRVEKLIIYPDGKSELLYSNFESEGNKYKISSFELENMDGSKIARESTNSMDEILWTKKFSGEITGEKVRVIPRVVALSDDVSDKELEKVRVSIKPIIIELN